MTNIKELKEITRPMFTSGKVHFYSICKIIDYVMPTYWEKHTKKSFDEMQELVRKFQESHHMNSYSAPRGDFSFLEAEKETLELNLTNCIVEDLS